MSKFSRHIKQDSIRNIILKDGPCENKLSELRVMVGLPPAAVEPSSTEGVAEPLVPSGVEENVGDSLRQDRWEKDRSGKKKKLKIVVTLK